jgi:glycogen debranching enzyme
VLVTNLSGEITGEGAEGFYAENTRMLSRLQLCIGGQALRPVAASPVGGDRMLAYYEAAPGQGVPEKSVYLTVDTSLSDILALQVTVENFSLAGRAFDSELAIELAADFADSQEAEQGRRQQDAAVDAELSEHRNEVRFRYLNAQLRRACRVRLSGINEPVRVQEQGMRVPVRLASHASISFRLEVTPEFEDSGALPASASVLSAQRRLSMEAPRIYTSNDAVARAWRTAIRDLASLSLGEEAGPAAPIAGIPLYQQFFGRDTLTTAWQAGMAMPLMLRDALSANAGLVGRAVDDWLDEEPGKMIHQATRGPLAALGLTNNLRNYGDYATGPDFLIMLGQYLLWSDDRATVRSLLPVARLVIEWVRRYADIDGDGLIEYRTRSPKGVKNQGWKDADDAIVDGAGRVVDPPIATIELQAYLYTGLQQAALAFAIAGRDRAYALGLLQWARRLRRRINSEFWMADQGFYAMALGPDKQQVGAISSNPAHALACGVVPRDRAGSAVRRLMAPDMFSGWGIRTLSSDNPAYNPFSYHRGSVWPVENGTAAIGLARYGRWDDLDRLAKGLFDLSELFQEGRLPECVGGCVRDAAHPHPGIYPASCEPQAWSASMVIILIQSLLGMIPIAPLGLLVVDPHLPPWLPDLRIDGITVGSAKVDLNAWRDSAGRTRFRWRREGKVRVVRQAPPNARAGLGERLWSAVSPH